MTDKPIAELSPEQAEARREQWRVKKAASRERLAATRFADFENWTWTWGERYPDHAAELREHEREFEAAVSAELGRDVHRSTNEDFAVNRLIVCLVGLRKKDRPWLCRTDQGFVACGRFTVDGIAPSLIYDSHHHGLKASPTYAQALHELLTLINQYDFPSGMIPRSERLVIEQELAGTYEYIAPPPPPKVEPAIEPPKEEPLPRYEEHMQVQS